jgi:hypothetical protein
VILFSFYFIFLFKILFDRSTIERIVWYISSTIRWELLILCRKSRIWGFVGRWIVNLLTKYWIFVTCGMLLLVSIQNTVVIYRIIYMAFYLFFILSFQVRRFFFDKDIKSKFSLKISFGFWRRTAATFQLVIIIYSMIILIGLYIFQVIFFSLSNFKNTPCFLCFSLKQSLNF